MIMLTDPQDRNTVIIKYYTLCIVMNFFLIKIDMDSFGIIIYTSTFYTLARFTKSKKNDSDTMYMYVGHAPWSE